MPEILITPANGEPLDLAEAKLHLRITEDSQDSLVAAFIGGARQAAEMLTRNQLLHARWKLVLDRFPGGGYGLPGPLEHAVNIPPGAIQLPHVPLAEVESITYVDTGGVTQTVDPSVYVVNDALRPGIITPRFGQIWPIPMPQIASVQVTYTAGYASVFTVSGNNIIVEGPVTWAVGDLVRFYNSGGALPTGLAENTNYLIASAASGVYTIKTTAGAAVTLGGTPSGTNYIGVVPAGIRNWMKLRIGSMYQNREEVAILSRGAVHELPFIDGLLDPYKVVLP